MLKHASFTTIGRYLLQKYKKYLKPNRFSAKNLLMESGNHFFWWNSYCASIYLQSIKLLLVLPLLNACYSTENKWYSRNFTSTLVLLTFYFSSNLLNYSKQISEVFSVKCEIKANASAKSDFSRFVCKYTLLFLKYKRKAAKSLRILQNDLTSSPNWAGMLKCRAFVGKELLHVTISDILEYRIDSL